MICYIYPRRWIASYVSRTAKPPTSDEVKIDKIELRNGNNKGGRKRLGDKKRMHAITLRFNGAELEKVKTILQSYNLDFRKRGTVGPFLRKLILNKETVKEKRIPDGISNLKLPDTTR